MGRRQYWLIKSEPSVYPYTQLEAERRTGWTGVRNFEARNNLRAMKAGDLALYYHSGEGKEIVGVARLLSGATEDPTAPGEDWSAVEVEPVVALSQPISLKDIKGNRELAQFPLVTRSRLSVAPVTAQHFNLILKMGRTRLPRE